MTTSKRAINFVKIAVAAVFLLFQAWLIFGKSHDTLYIDARPNAVPSPLIEGGTEVGQTFVAHSDGLGRIDVMLGTYARVNNQDIVFRLWEGGPGHRLVAKTIFNAVEAADNLYRAFIFESIRKSGGKMYTFVLSSPSSTWNNSLSVWMNTADVYPEGEALLNGVPIPGDLTFRTYAKRSVSSELGRLLSHNASKLPGGKVLLIAVILFFEWVQVVFLLRMIGGLGPARDKTGGGRGA
ncbi:MAG TPA: hypothetical protein VGB72_01000 [Acidobacteriota bacterium]